MRYREKQQPHIVVSVMTFAQLKRFGSDHHNARGWFYFHGLDVDGCRVFKHSDPLFVLYKGGKEIGELAEGDSLIIEDGGAVYPLARATFEERYERDPDWNGGPAR